MEMVVVLAESRPRGVRAVDEEAEELADGALVDGLLLLAGDVLADLEGFLRIDLGGGGFRAGAMEAMAETTSDAVRGGKWVVSKGSGGCRCGAQQSRAQKLR